MTGKQPGKVAPANTPPPDWFSWPLWLLLVFAGVLLIALRTPRDWLHPVFYAEDGAIFFRDQIIEGSSAILHTYHGYFHLIPRVAAAVASEAPARDEPFLYCGFNVLIQSLAATFFFLPRNRVFVRSDGLRLAVCLLTFVDFQAYEMLNNVMVVQWFLFPVAILMLGHLSSSRIHLSQNEVFLYCVVMAVICLTTPLLLIVLPVAVVLLLRGKGRSRFVPLTMVICVLIQGAAFLRTGFSDPSPPQSLVGAPWIARAAVSIMGSWIYRDVLTVIAGESAAKRLAERGGELPAGVIFVVILAGCYVIRRRFPRTQSRIVLGAFAGSIGLVAISFLVRNLVAYFGDNTHFDFFGGGARYFFISGWLILVTGAVLVEKILSKQSESAKFAVLFALFGFGAIQNFPVQESPSRNWPKSAVAIEQWRTSRDRGMPTAPVTAPINPGSWVVDLPAR